MFFALEIHNEQNMGIQIPYAYNERLPALVRASPIFLIDINMRPGLSLPEKGILSIRGKTCCL